jgi:thiosulfate dehydrogenase (quinone) large subunit
MRDIAASSSMTRETLHADAAKRRPLTAPDATTQGHTLQLDRRLAHGILRLTLGVNMLMHGVVRVPDLAGFADGIVASFAETPLPPLSVRLFALSLPFIEAGIRFLLVLGLFTRWALVAGGLVMTALVFGTALRSDWETVGIQMIYAAIYSLLLAGKIDNDFSLDTVRATWPGRFERF